MAITRTDRDQVFGPDGQVVSETVVERDITVEFNKAEALTKLGQAKLALRSVRDAVDLPGGTLTALQLSNAVRQAQTNQKLLARALIELVKHVRDEFQEAD